MKTHLFISTILCTGLCLVNCSEDKLVQNQTDQEQEDGSGNNDSDKDDTLGDLPPLGDVDDVCIKMNDLNFRAYCYENFDLNGDSKVSMTETNTIPAIECNDAISFAGLEYFTNITIFKSSSVQKADFRYNRNLKAIDCGSSNIESVDLSYNNKLMSINFSNCKLLINVALPDNLTSIGENAFYYCSSLTSIDIPDGVTSIGNDAFAYCSSLTSIDIPDGVTNIGNGVFGKCSSLASIDIPAGVTSIGESAFYGCSSLTSIDIPDGVKSIEYYTFKGCGSLETVDASQCMNIESINDSAFKNCPIKEFLLGASNPPSLTTQTLYISSFDYMPDAVLKVPAESVEAYKNSDWADYFGTIEAL